jgi:hypothetical protein
MEYRFSLTPRLVAIGLFAVVALLVLLFALGFQLGQRLGGKPASPVVPAAIANRIERHAGAAAASLRDAVPDHSAPVQKDAP